MNLKELSIKELLKLQSSSLEELRARNILRSANKPTGDFAEYLFCRAFSWNRSNNKSKKGFDATDSAGMKYQIKGRQLIKNNHGERALSAIRNLKERKFDFIAGILFNKDYSVYRAAIIPYQAIIESKPSYSSHDNKHRFYLRDSVWDMPDVQDVTKQLIQIFESV